MADRYAIGLFSWIAVWCRVVIPVAAYFIWHGPNLGGAASNRLLKNGFNGGSYSNLRHLRHLRPWVTNLRHLRPW